MSFSSDVKNELVHIETTRSCCMLTEISAYTQTCGSLRFAGFGRFRLVYRTDNAVLAKRLFLLLKKRMDITPAMEFTRYSRLGGQRVCQMTVNESDTRRLLIALRMIRESESGVVFKGVPRTAMTRRCCRSAFVRGAFLGAGSVTSPEVGYHLEFWTSDSLADLLMNVFEKNQIVPLLTQRRGKNLLYIDKGDDVADCLALMGASQARMEMENIRIRKDSRNQANRARNCDTANLNKQLRTGGEQAQLIEDYAVQYGLEHLPEKCREIAELRMKHPEMSLEELGQQFQPALSKSGVNHRLQRLMEVIQSTEE